MDIEIEMGDEDSIEAPRERHKLFKKYHWREKLFSKEDKTEKDTDQDSKLDDDVDEFLAPSKLSLPSRTQTNLKPEVSAPRIDVSVSQRWPTAHTVPEAINVNALHTRQYSRGRSESPPRRRGRKGLNVKFTNKEPEIIGEGGDEADIPTQEISLARARSHSPTLEHTGRAGSGPSSGREGNGSVPIPDGTRNPRPVEDFQPKVLVREPTELAGDGEKTRSPYVALSAQEMDYNISIQPGSHVSMRQASDPNSFAARVQAKMRAEEGMAFQKGVRDPSPGPGPGPSAHRQPEPSAGIESLQYRPPSAQRARSSEDVPDYSLRPTPVPAVRGPVQAPATQGSLPSLLIPGASQPTLIPDVSQPPPYTQQEPISAAPDQPPPRSGNESGEEPKPQTRSLRNVAHAVGDDALGDFAARVAPCNALFGLAAESVKPVMETSLSEWIRASIWWFLKGRAEIEMSARSRPRSSGEHPPRIPSSSQPTQGFVNLAKAWWVNQHIVPQHPELRRYGNMSTSSLIAVVKNVGDSELATLIELHQGIVAHLRALTISMKRNDLLPRPLEQVALPQGIDTAIWIRYPFFAADVDAILSGSNMESMLVERRGTKYGIAEVMPMGDSSSHFNYGRMFVTVGLTSVHDQSQEFAVPCLLSIMRETSDWYVKVAIASQNDLVSIMVQADKKRGPTWDDVDWQVQSHSIRIRLPRGFEMDVQFQEQDFKTLWNIVEYTRKTEASLQPQPGEILRFEEVSKVLHYIDTGTTKPAFPPEPSKRCRIRLFERFVIVTEGTGKRKAHRGFRLTAVTSPMVKTLSHVSHVICDGSPLVFSYLRGDDGAPALLLKIEENERKRAMVLTFHEATERAEMHSLLIGIGVGNGESKFSDLSLQGFSLEPLVKGESTSPIGSDALKQFEWKSTKVINEDPRDVSYDYGQTVLSENLRICMESSSGTITDRINLGAAICVPFSF